MKKSVKIFCAAAGLIVLIGCAGLLSDRYSLQNDLVRLHVVANSNSEQDQENKLRVRDALIRYLQPQLQALTDTDQALQYLHAHVEDMEAVALQALQEVGDTSDVQISLEMEEFDTRVYDTFSLPAGLYHSLRVQIGEAEGRNWWCVVFPSLCLPATSDGFSDTAVASGFGSGLTNTLSRRSGYEVRFFFLDCLGRIQNFFHPD